MEVLGGVIGREDDCRGCEIKAEGEAEGEERISEKLE